MKFWDASAIIPLCLDAPQTSLVKQIAQEDGALVAWWATPIECYSAFARLRRDGIVTRAGEEQARQALTRLAAEWTEIQPGNEMRDSAARALLFHSLRAADSLQLAAALAWARGRPAGQEFVCLDQRLREAASREGFLVVPEL